MDLDPETNTTVSFSHAYDEGRTAPYVVAVVVKDDQDHSDMTWAMLGTEVEVEEKETSLSSALLIGIGLAILIAAIAIAMLVRRKGKGEAASGSGMDEMEGMAPPETPEDAGQSAEGDTPDQPPAE